MMRFCTIISVVVLLAALLFAACGIKGPPRPPEDFAEPGNPAPAQLALDGGACAGPACAGGGLKGPGP